ncbi:hypothetical protein C1645_750732 [Glomus cerebriforme]|uniref:HMG box domain-containing protein n=1 Tax=Glomus cerebriforme TaxID=658196 RepID=A0A397TJI6_9GLOM|nr:hypothetical protein C1645_750732 [Glomus cerebriforme]
MSNESSNCSHTSHNISTLLQYRPPYPYTSPLRNLITSSNKSPNGFKIYRQAYYNIINKQNGCNLKMNKLSSIASILWKQEPANVKLYYCNLARNIRSKFKLYPTIFARQNIINDIRSISQSSPTRPVPHVVQNNPCNNSSNFYINFEELALHINQGIPFPAQTSSVFSVSSSFETFF